MEYKKVAIIGAGPAGCMCAYFAKEHANVTLFDFKSSLSTLLCTGGGRCNLAYAEYDFRELAKFYPRGEKFLYSVLSKFSTADTIDFFENIGVKIYVQDDLRVFPVSNSASKVRSSMLNALSECSFVKEKVIKIEKNEKFIITTGEDSYFFDAVVIAVGGHAGFKLAKELGHAIVDPKPALCGLISNEKFKSIQGVSLKDIEARISCHCKKFAPVKGDLIFTHEGISGPLAYKISSICAREDYNRQNPLKIELNLLRHCEGVNVLIDADARSRHCETWVSGSNNECPPKQSSLNACTGKIPHQVRDDMNIDGLFLQNLLNSNPKKDIKNLVSEFVPKSLAEYILKINGIALDKKCCDISGVERDNILKSLSQFEVTVISPSKDGEVVTSGGVCLDKVNAKTMESKLVNGLYFCGEVLDIDGFCGGFNLQNCWSTGFVAGNSI